MVYINKCKCKQCGYQWIPRIERPVACPSCNRRSWDKDPKQRAAVPVVSVAVPSIDEDDPFQPTAFDERGNPLVYSEDDFD